MYIGFAGDAVEVVFIVAVICTVILSTGAIDVHLGFAILGFVLPPLAFEALKQLLFGPFSSYPNITNVYVALDGTVGNVY